MNSPSFSLLPDCGNLALIRAPADVCLHAVLEATWSELRSFVAVEPHWGTDTESGDKVLLYRLKPGVSAESVLAELNKAFTPTS